MCTAPLSMSTLSHRLRTCSVVFVVSAVAISFAPVAPIRFPEGEVIECTRCQGGGFAGANTYHQERDESRCRLTRASRRAESQRCRRCLGPTLRARKRSRPAFSREHLHAERKGTQEEDDDDERAAVAAASNKRGSRTCEIYLRVFRTHERGESTKG